MRPGWIVVSCLLLVAPSACGPGPEDEVELARGLQQRGEYPESIGYLRRVLDAAPGNPDALHLLGVALLHTGETGAAVWPLLRASQSEPLAAEAGGLLAQVLLATRNPEEALATAERALALQPEAPALLHVRGRARLALGEPGPALADAEALLARGPEDPAALALRAAALEALHRIPEARDAFGQLAGVGERSGDVELAARSCLALAAFQSRIDRDGEAARAAAHGCAERFPTDAGVLLTTSALLDAGAHRDEATQLWRAAHSAQPDELPLAAGLAERLEREGRIDEARTLWRETASRLDTPEIHQLRAGFLRRQGEVAEAREALERAIDLAGEAPASLHFGEVDLLIDLGELERAEQRLASVEDPKLRRLLRGRLELARDDPARALAALDEGLAAWPDNPGARQLAARAAAELGDADRAVAELRAAFRARRSDPEPALAAARLHLALGDPASALGLLSLVLSRPVEDPAPYLLMARAHALLHEPEAAGQALERAGARGARPTELAVERAGIAGAAEGPAAAAAGLERAPLDWGAPESEPALALLVELHTSAGQPERALASLDRALAAGERASLQDLRGRTLLRAGREREAEQAFERARALDPDAPGPRVGLAMLAARAGRLRAALFQVERALASDAIGPATRFGAARLLRLAGRGDEALAQLELVVRDDPGHAEACSELARALVERGRDLERAERLVRRAQRIDPQPSHQLVLDELTRRRAGPVGAS